MKTTNTRMREFVCVIKTWNLSNVGAMEAGAKREYGGEVVEVPGLEGGFYLSPCILTAVTQDMRVYRVK